MISATQSARIAELRLKASNGSISREEMKEVIDIMREGRVAASQASAKSRAKKAPVDSEAMLKELEGL